MITLDLGNFRKGRLWINDFNRNYPKSMNLIERFIQTFGGEKWPKKQIAFELFLPRNHSNYAMVGFEYTPTHSNDDKVHILVHVAEEKIKYDQETLAMKSDPAFWGIPEYYAMTVLDVAAKTISSISSFPAGTIEFNIGLHSDTGSSNVMFTLVTKILLQLAMLDLHQMGDDEIQTTILEIYENTVEVMYGNR